jgi:hypothetical protein
MQPVKHEPDPQGHTSAGVDAVPQQALMQPLAQAV